MYDSPLQTNLKLHSKKVLSDQVSYRDCVYPSLREVVSELHNTATIRPHLQLSPISRRKDGV